MCVLTWEDGNSLGSSCAVATVCCTDLPGALTHVLFDGFCRDISVTQHYDADHICISCSLFSSMSGGSLHVVGSSCHARHSCAGFQGLGGM